MAAVKARAGECGAREELTALASGGFCEGKCANNLKKKEEKQQILSRINPTRDAFIYPMRAGWPPFRPSHTNCAYRIN